MESETDPILVRVEPPLGWVIVNRPDARNALTRPMWHQMAAGIQALSDAPDVRVLILTGAGASSFISGADINELKAQLEQGISPDESVAESLEGLQAICDSPKPIIAMINGHCYGGGVLIAAMCDLRFASAAATFGITASRLGLAYPLEQGTLRLVQTIGPAHAADLLFSARSIDAEEAARMGLLNRVIAPEALERETRAYADLLARAAPLSIAAHKRGIQQALLGAPDLAAARDAFGRCYQSDDFREGLAAFAQKRAPVFAGR